MRDDDPVPPWTDDEVEETARRIEAQLALDLPCVEPVVLPARIRWVDDVFSPLLC